MQLFTLLRLLPFLLFVNLLSTQVSATPLHMKHPDSGNANVDKTYSQHFGTNILNDPFINLAQQKYGSSGMNYFAVTNGTPVIESKFAVPEKPENILRDYVIDFRRCNYPFTIHRISDTTYMFTGEVGNQVKKVLAVFDPEQQITMCSFTCETDDHELLLKRQKTLERFPELSQLPGEIVYFKEYHQGPIISICVKVQFRGNAQLAMNELTARFNQFGWQSNSSRIMNHQDFIKTGATARISAIDTRFNSTALIVISDQSQLLQ